MDDAPRTPTSSSCIFLTVLGPAGALGRSAVAVNVAALLADRGFRVLLVDADLSSPGLSHLVEGSPAGLSELLLAAIDGVVDGRALGRLLHPVPLPRGLAEPAGALVLLPAGRAAGRVPGLASGGPDRGGGPLDLGDRAGNLAQVLRDMVEETGPFDHVLLDSSGVGPGGAIAGALADGWVVVSGLRPADLDAAARIVADLDPRAREDAGPPSAADPGSGPSSPSSSGRRSPPTIVLGPIPAGEDALVAERLEAARRALSRAFGGPLLPAIELPDHPRLALTLELHVLQSGRGPLAAAYRRIAARLLAAVGDTLEAAIDRAADAASEGRWGPVRELLARARRLADGAPGWIDGFVGAYGSAEPPEDPAALAEVDALVLAEASSSALRGLARALRRRADAAAAAGELDAAEGLYHRALAAGPDDVITLGKLASFAEDAGRDPAEVEALYRRAIDADPDDAVNLGNLANFLCDVRRDLDGAEAMYRRAIAADPDNAANHGNYAAFLADERGATADAEAMLRRALEIDPDGPSHHANLGRLLLGGGRTDEGIDAVDRALALADDEASALDVECWMYLYCCDPARRGPALARLRGRIVDDGITTGAWDFSAVIAAARRAGHPEGEWLGRLAEVLAGAQPVDALAGWAAFAADE